MASFDALSPATLYRILRLREAVFAIEQRCVYVDLDGRDADPSTLHLWIDDDQGAATVASCLRVLTQPDGARKIGRVVTAAPRRGEGLAGQLLDHALALVPANRSVVLDAQVRLAPWYARWGFTRRGPDFEEDGIMHTPMRRPPDRAPGGLPTIF